MEQSALRTQDICETRYVFAKHSKQLRRFSPRSCVDWLNNCSYLTNRRNFLRCFGRPYRASQSSESGYTTTIGSWKFWALRANCVICHLLYFELLLHWANLSFASPADCRIGWSFWLRVLLHIAAVTTMLIDGSGTNKQSCVFIFHSHTGSERSRVVICLVQINYFTWYCIVIIIFKFDFFNIYAGNIDTDQYINDNTM